MSNENYAGNELAGSRLITFIKDFLQILTCKRGSRSSYILYSFIKMQLQKQSKLRH